MPDLNERDAKIVQWLNEAHAKEAELEADLTAHIALTEKASYKKRLRDHLKETKDHKRRVASRIKKLGGAPSAGPNVPGVPSAVGEAAGKTIAAVKGQVGAARAVVTEQNETHVRNAQEELREEHVEIAIYSRIETFCDAVGDRETAQLAKSIRRDEERMAKFLDAELKRLVKSLVTAQVPRAQRTSSSSRRTAGSRSTSRSKPASGAKASRSKPASGAKASRSKRASGAKASRSKPASRSKSAPPAKSTSRSTSRASGSGARKTSGSRSRRSSSRSRSR